MGGVRGCGGSEARGGWGGHIGPRRRRSSRQITAGRQVRHLHIFIILFYRTITALNPKVNALEHRYYHVGPNIEPCGTPLFYYDV